MKVPVYIPSPARVVDGFVRMAREESPASPEAWMDANLDLLTVREREELVGRLLSEAREWWRGVSLVLREAAG